MAKYEHGDIVTYYFIVANNNVGGSIIQAWTDDKNLAKFYMDFHKSDNLIMKSVTKRIDDIYKILEENVHDEIKIHNITTRNVEKKRKKDPEDMRICIPATETESNFISSEVSTFMASRIRYSYLNSAIPYLKNKYKFALEDIFLPEVIDFVCNNRTPASIQHIVCDELMVLYRSFPEMFGK